MILKPTTFVLGAGASHPYGFPLGTELVDRVCSTLADHNGDVRRILRVAGFPDNDIEQFRNQLHKSRASSIDRFLTWMPKLQPVGKAAMAAILMPLEKDKSFGDAQGPLDWYRYLFDHMLGRGLNDFLRNRLSVVTFNFDRSFERALYRTLQSSFVLTDDQAADACSRVPVVHVHGELGAPSWLQPNAPNARDYRPAPASPHRGEREGDLNPDDIKICADSIRLFSEACPESTLEDALVLLGEAERVCFLGFGYQDDNVEKLACSQWWRTGRVYHGSTFGLEDGEETGVLRLFPERFQILRADCRTFLRKTDYIRD